MKNGSLRWISPAAMLCLALITLSGCGSDGPAPAPVDTAGAWSGRIQFQPNNPSAYSGMTMELVQEGSTVTGTHSWDGERGIVQGTIDSAGLFDFTLSATNHNCERMGSAQVVENRMEGQVVSSTCYTGPPATFGLDR